MYLLKRFEPGDILFRQGDPSDHVVLVRSGQAQSDGAVVAAPRAKPNAMAAAAFGAFVGEETLGSSHVHGRGLLAGHVSDDLECVGR